MTHDAAPTLPARPTAPVTIATARRSLIEPDMIPKVLEQFEPGTPVRVTQVVQRRDQSYEAEVVGVVMAWEDEPTGSWHAHGKNDKLWLKRLKLRKADGEVTKLVVDDSTRIARIEAAK